jgi:hypothetical protein
MGETDWQAVKVFLMLFVSSLAIMSALYKALHYFFAKVLKITDRQVSFVIFDSGLLRFIIYPALFFAASESGTLAVLVAIILASYIEKESAVLRANQKRRKGKSNRPEE